MFRLKNISGSGIKNGYWWGLHRKPHTKNPYSIGGHGKANNARAYWDWLREWQAGRAARLALKAGG